MRKSSLLLLIAAMSIARAGGPTYSRHGIGDLKYFGSNRAFAIGVLGASLGGDEFINRFNPAGLSRISLTRISGGFEFSRLTIKDQSGSTTFARGDFQTFALAVPVSTDHGVTLFAETSPYSDVHYKVQVREMTTGSPSLQTFTGIGGLSSLSLGTSYSPRGDLSLGFKYSYIYGTIEQVTNVDFDDITFTNSEFHSSRFHSGSVFTLGVLIEDLGSFLGSPSLTPLRVGAVVSMPAKLSVKEENVLLTSTSADTTSIVRGKTDLPLSVGIGVSYLVQDRLMFTSDVFLQQWQGANFFGESSVSTKNSLRFAAGVEFLPKQTPTTYGDRVAYRGGFVYNGSYIKVNGEAINEWYVSGGIGLPIGPGARMNVAVQVGSRGTMTGGLQKDNFVRFAVSVSASEAWFLTLEDE